MHFAGVHALVGKGMAGAAAAEIMPERTNGTAAAASLVGGENKTGDLGDTKVRVEAGSTGCRPRMSVLGTRGGAPNETEVEGVKN